MAIINGKEYTKHDLLQRVGNIGQIAGVRPVVLADGRAAGVHALDVKTGGGLEFSVLQDKGMDLFDFSFKGTNVCFQSKPGVVSAQLADLYGMGSGFKHSIAGGMMYTCGLQNNGGACVDQGSDHVFNGRIRNIPAEKLSIISKWDGDEYLLGVEGDIRETGLFSSNLVMHRSIHTKLGAKSLTLCDEVTNEGFSNAFPMIMYHINLGYPLLDENMHLILPDAQMEGLGELAQRDIASYNVMTPPTANAIEYAFVRHQATDSYGWSAAAAYNDNIWLDLAAVCEPSVMFEGIKGLGSSRVLWGTDFPISMGKGRCVSLGAGFLWMSKHNLCGLAEQEATGGVGLYVVEELMAFYQACRMLELSETDREKIFYNNAKELFFSK